MSADSAFINLKSRFNALTLRERAMVALAALALVVLLWDRALMNPLGARRQQLQQELVATQQSLALLSSSIEGRAQDNPFILANKQKQEMTQSIAAVDKQLQSESAGLIPPERMLDVLRDVLDSQRDLRLISMRNLPVTSLVPPAPSTNAGPNNGTAANTASATPIALQGPYVHSMELVVEGSYLDVLRYLQKVEALPWKFYWQAFDLKATEYPLNRVRIRLNTLSMDKEWLGV